MGTGICMQNRSLDRGLISLSTAVFAAITLGLLWMPCISYASGTVAKAILTIDVTIEQASVGVELAQQQCARDWKFAPDFPGTRGERWKPVSDFEWIGPETARGKHSCVRRIAFTSTIGEKAVDRTYPFLVGAEDGVFVYLPHLIPIGFSGDLTILVHWETGPCAKSGKCVSKLTKVWPDSEAQGYIALGPKNLALQGLYADSSLPGWLRTQVEHSHQNALSEGARQFGDLGSEKPALAILFDGSVSGVSWRGWTKSNMLFLSFSGKGWEHDNPELANIVQTFTTHETLHLWNAWRYRASSGGIPAWLTEGFAEYFAIAAVDSAANASDLNRREQLARRFDGCLKSREEQVSDSKALQGLYGDSAYDCGVTVMWLLDHRLRQSHGSGGVSDLWREVFKRDSEGYTLASVREAYGAIAGDSSGFDLATSWLINGSDDPGALVEVLRENGVAVARNPRSDSYVGRVRESLIMPLLESVCSTGPLGYSTFDAWLVLDTGDRCGVLSENPAVSSIEDKSLFNDELPNAATSMIVKCKLGRSVALGLQNGKRILVPCSKPPAILVAPLEVDKSTISIGVHR